MKDIKYTKRGVIIAGSTFVSGDYHIGYSDEIDTMTIQQEIDEISQNIRDVLESHNLERFVLNGDIFHEFSPASEEARNLYQEMAARIELDCELVAIRGNHDSATESEYPDLVNFQDHLLVSDSKTDFVITHGHEEPDITGDIYVLNHLHPTVRIDGIQWPVYLKGSNIYQESDVLVLPSFNSYQDGVIVSPDILLDIDFPLVQPKEFRNLKPLVYDQDTNNVRAFPRLGESSKYFE